MALSETTVRHARANGCEYTLKDSDGLVLLVKTNGSRIWHFRFYWNGEQQRMSLGVYPAIGLKDARTRRDEARNLVAKGIDPRVHRRQERAAAAAATANTFEAVFRLWCDFKAKALTVKTDRQGTLSQINRIFAKDVLPYLGKRSIFEVARADVVEVLRKIERRNAHEPRPHADHRHHHAHLLMTTREIGPNGLGARTTLDLSGTERHARGLGPSLDELLWMRKRWAQVTNEALRDAGLAVRVDHRSYKDQGIDRESQAVIPRAILYSGRQELMRGLDGAAGNLKAAGVQKIWINGSFVTSKKVPNDVDGCWEYTENVNIGLLDPMFLAESRLPMKEKYGVELFPAFVTAAENPSKGIAYLFAA